MLELFTATWSRPVIRGPMTFQLQSVLHARGDPGACILKGPRGRLSLTGDLQALPAAVTLRTATVIVIFRHHPINRIMEWGIGADPSAGRAEETALYLRGRDCFAFSRFQHRGQRPEALGHREDLQELRARVQAHPHPLLHKLLG
ncbi:hypothetical protein AAFF_G00160500 [Aldrovandia affinis]|uniref:Uncharacterized protein n=1 Tax=Aldrovandia affinis TaxID=143900 RepID=A0AAD7RN41_9TELE|nr:hypothetical protein AAFF_G00160500 [Aldrovandia affinis]